MLRILILCEYASMNGGERSLLAALGALDPGEIECVVAAPPAGPLIDELHSKGIQQHPLRFHDQRGVRMTPDQLRSQLTKLIVATGSDLVHCNSLSTSRLAGPVVRELNIPSLGHLRDIMSISARAVSHLNCHHRLLAVSNATQVWYEAAGVDGKKLSVEYNGVDLVRFRPRVPSGSLHAELGLPQSALLVGSVGQIGIRKGLDVLIESANTVLRHRTDVHFIVVGQRYSQKAESIQFEAALHAAAGRAPLDGHIHFLGSRPDVNQLMGEWDLLAHVARQEPLGRVLLEAAASGLAIVATRVGGTEEIFPAGADAAELIPADSPTDLSRTILELLESRDRRDRLGCSARRRAESQFDARVAGRRLAHHYRQTAERK